MNSNTQHQGNNFTFIRLCLSVMVTVTHAYTLSGRDVDWIHDVTNGQVFTGWLCFKFFFVISGYLIFRSLQASKSILSFLWKRALRIYPALFVMLILTLLYGQFVYEGSVPYLQNKDVLTYLPNNLLMLDMQYGIQGIFENNPYRSAINGSLWSLPYELVCYVLFTGFFFLRKNKNACRILLLLTFVLLYTGNFYLEAPARDYRFFKLVGTYLLDLGTFFTAGAFLGTFKFEALRYRNSILAAGLVLLMLSFYFNCFRELQYFTLPLVILPLGSASTKYIRSTDHVIGDISYGVYIYSFPVQQTLVYYFGPGPVTLMITSLAIAILLGYVSWNLIEKRAIRLKSLTLSQLLYFLPWKQAAVTDPANSGQKSGM